jgi:hypothetical protein
VKNRTSLGLHGLRLFSFLVSPPLSPPLDALLEFIVFLRLGVYKLTGNEKINLIKLFDHNG